MIVRISNEGQYEVADEDIAELNELDNEAVAGCEATDEQTLPRRVRAPAGAAFGPRAAGRRR